MQNTDLSKIFWKEASRAGLIAGGCLAAWAVLSYALRLEMKYTTLISLVELLVIVGVLWFTGKRMSEIRGPGRGYPFGYSMGFVLATMMFTGIITGFVQYVLQVVIDPAYYNELYELRLYRSNLDEAMIDEVMNAREVIDRFLKNPIMVIVTNIIALGIYGGLIGLAVSAFLKKQPEPFAPDQPEEEGTFTDL